MSDRIEKSIELKAPVSKVWKALTDYREFGEWFRVTLEGPFVAGQAVRGRITHPGYEHLTWHAVVRQIEPAEWSEGGDVGVARNARRVVQEMANENLTSVRRHLR